MKKRRYAAFSLVELLVAAGISTAVGLIIYGVATEGLADFARNVSINRSYSNARQSIDRVSISMQSAGHVPVLVDATGADVLSTTTSQVAGIRFWRNVISASYPIVTAPPLTLASTSVTVNLTDPTTSPATPLPSPMVGDMITIPVLCFQARATSVSVVTAGTIATATISFSGSLVSNTNPTLTATALATAITGASKSYTGKMSCLNWTSVAFIAVNNQLRYFPKFISGSTSVSTPANYQILTYLTASLGSANTPLPFSLGPPPSINIDVYAEAPDYNNRTTIAGSVAGYNGLSTANTYTLLQTALSPRNSSIIRNP